MFDKNAWYIFCKKGDLKSQPISKQIAGEKVVVYRFDNQIIALQDRCCHRGVPLSKGCVKNGNLVCPYHGWEFNREGLCTHIPELEANQKIPQTAKIKSFMVQEHAGFIWVCLSEDPFLIKDPSMLTLNDKTFLGLHNSAEVECFWTHMVENTLDGAHLSHVHNGSLENGNKWLFNWSRKFRKKKKQESPNNLKIDKTETGFIAYAKDEREKLNFCFNVKLPSTITIELNFSDKAIRVWVHVVPISNTACRIEHIFYRNFAKTSFLNPLFNRSALKFLKEDVTIVELLQPSYNESGFAWENSCPRDRVPLFFRNEIKNKLPKLSEMMNIKSEVVRNKSIKNEKLTLI